MGKIERMDNKISFIGVGPGDTELLTLKALKKIKLQMSLFGLIL